MRAACLFGTRSLGSEPLKISSFPPLKEAAVYLGQCHICRPNLTGWGEDRTLMDSAVCMQVMEMVGMDTEWMLNDLLACADAVYA